MPFVFLIFYLIMLVNKFLVLRCCPAHYYHIGYRVMVFDMIFVLLFLNCTPFWSSHVFSHLYHCMHHRWNKRQVRSWLLPCVWVPFLFWRLEDIPKHVHNVLMWKCLFWDELDHSENALLIPLISLLKMWTAHINHFIDMKCHILRIFTHLSPVPLIKYDTRTKRRSFIRDIVGCEEHEKSSLINFVNI